MTPFLDYLHAFFTRETMLGRSLHAEKKTGFEINIYNDEVILSPTDSIWRFALRRRSNMYSFWGNHEKSLQQIHKAMQNCMWEGGSSTFRPKRRTENHYKLNSDTVQGMGNKVKPLACSTACYTTVLSDSTYVLCLVFMGAVMREVEKECLLF